MSILTPARAHADGDQSQGETGAAVRASGLPRQDLFVTSKIPCCPSSFSGGAACARVGKDSAAWIEHDMATLGLDYVDLMLIHWPCDSWADTVATYKALEPMIANKKARAIGISNFNASQVTRLLGEVANGALTVPPSVNQCGYSVGGHAASETPWGRDDPTVAACKAGNVTYSAYSPLGGWTKVDVLKDPDVLAVAAAHGKNAAQVALRWLSQQDIVVVTSSDKESHDEGDLAIFDFELTDAEMARLAAVQAKYEREA